MNPNIRGAGAIRRLGSRTTLGGTDGAVALLSVEDVRVEFGGILALADLSFDDRRRPDLRADRPERRRARRRCSTASAASTRRRAAASASTATNLLDAAGASHRAARHRAHVPEPRAVPGAHRRRERDGRRPLARRVDAHAGVATRVEILERLSLAELADRPAIGLAVRHAQAHRDRARARGAAAACCCLDEPAAGLTHSEVDELGDTRAGAARRVRPHACCSSSTTWRW